MTYTLATMPIRREHYDQIREKLRRAGYGHAIHDDGTLDMTHIGLVIDESDEILSTPTREKQRS